MATMKVILPYLVFQLLWIHIHGQTDPDPLADFCRRWGHQTTIIDGKLFIDGGLVDYGGGITSSTVNETNTYLLYLDLDGPLIATFPVEYANLSKPSYVPSVQGGILWADTSNKFFYLYGGDYSFPSQPPSNFTLWAYDAINNVWNTVTSGSGISSISGSSYGAGTVVDDRALAYWYGGWESNTTVAGWNGSPVAQSGLIRYDMVHNQWSNTSFLDAVPRAEGVMFYIPASDAGMLVYFGGVQQSSNGSYIGEPMNQIYLYDIGSSKWYLQTTSGTPPDMRRRFCGGVSWPEDQSSYNIYFYGGLPPYNQQGFGYGDVWILSLPSFTWIQWYYASPGSEHHSLSCNVVDQSQMIVMGGYFPNSSNIGCDAKTIWGQHNLNLGANDISGAPWYQFLPNVTSYQVPSNVTAVIGGSLTGGATLTIPVGGWSNPDLGTYFTRKYKAVPRPATRSVPTIATSTTATPTPTASATKAPNPTHSDAGPIAGGVIGGVAVLAIVVLGVWICLRRRQKRQQERQSMNPAAPGDQGMEQQSRASPVFSHKRGVSGSTMADVATPRSVPPEFASNDRWSASQSPPQPHTNWLSGPDQYSQYSQAHSPPLQQADPGQRTPQQNRSTPPQPPQTYYPPPPQAQTYYPPPASHGRVSGQSTPTMSELPSVKSPVNIGVNLPIGRS